MASSDADAVLLDGAGRLRVASKEAPLDQGEEGRQLRRPHGLRVTAYSTMAPPIASARNAASMTPLPKRGTIREKPETATTSRREGAGFRTQDRVGCFCRLEPRDAPTIGPC
jgi:hypothetical protein